MMLCIFVTLLHGSAILDEGQTMPHLFGALTQFDDNMWLDGIYNDWNGSPFVAPQTAQVLAIA